jgi:uncharacterized cupin superfamily protein
MMLTVLNERGELASDVTQVLKHYEEQIKYMEEMRKNYLQAIQEAMEANGVKKFENDYIAITYVEPTSRVSLDTKQLKEDEFDLYLKYAKESPVKASVRIKVK